MVRRCRSLAAVLVIISAVGALRGATAQPAGAAPAGCAAVPSGTVLADGPTSYVPPVGGAVIDPFRAPLTPFGPGNRGIEYETVPGDPVGASAAGTVVFAGQVGGTLHVTVRHGDGVRTSYSLLDAIDVVVGQQVAQHEPVGRSGERLHLGARIGDVYVDPASLFGGEAHVELLPFEVPPGSAPGQEALDLARLAFDEGWSLPSASEVAGWLRGGAAGALTYASQLDLTTRGFGVARELGQRLFSPGACSEGPAPPVTVRGDSRRVAIAVAGLGSSATSAAIDDLRTDELGYAPGDVVRFSYRGGRVAHSGANLAGIAATDYVSADTEDDPHVVAARLADLVAQVIAAEPEATVDVYAHSLGGVVTRLALIDLDARGIDLDRIGLVATIASPHRGADLATAIQAVNGTVTGAAALDLAAEHFGVATDPGAAAVRQLSERSDVVRGLAAAGVPPGIEVLSIAARGDLVVTAPNTRVEGAVNVTVPVMGATAHSAVVGSDAATRELGLALAGLPPGCESWSDVLADVVVGESISLAEDALGFAVSTALP